MTWRADRKGVLTRARRGRPVGPGLPGTWSLVVRGETHNFQKADFAV